MPTRTTVADWTITASGDTATFTHASAPPRVWHGRGFAIAEADLAALDKALGEVMKLPVYWLARGRRDAGAGDAAVWSEPRHDPADESVHLAGPCRADEAGFAIDLVHLRGLRIRIASFRAAGAHG
ncbi:hypothetical protein [Amycolatopsis sp. SID8362]|uniref:hypothetical protein n=1 Tax=Amycolatopsis sp. SID8362 TaxID=2690346 RepID=UPI00136DB650|nr:hypothetical protein [Amycolatopsis sp. SID8362]NBH11513.1 hypothetical protein [Amycolatopsis sp. SID8362]NED48206.1 hypothetical protein [Amycolatopsis sp. SID8362]